MCIRDRSRAGRRPGGARWRPPMPRPARHRSRRTPPAERVRHRPEVCAGCGAALAEASVVSIEHRQVFDLPEIALRVVEHALEHRRCGCGRVTMADPPAGVATWPSVAPGCPG